MVVKKDLFQVMTVIVYITVIVAFFIFAKSENISPCKKNPCLRFCSENLNAINETTDESSETLWTKTDFIKLGSPCSDRKNKLMENKSIATWVK